MYRVCHIKFITLLPCIMMVQPHDSAMVVWSHALYYRAALGTTNNSHINDSRGGQISGHCTLFGGAQILSTITAFHSFTQKNLRQFRCPEQKALNNYWWSPGPYRFVGPQYGTSFTPPFWRLYSGRSHQSTVPGTGIADWCEQAKGMTMMTWSKRVCPFR